MHLHLNEGQRKGNRKFSRSVKVAYRFVFRNALASGASAFYLITLKKILLAGLVVLFVCAASPIFAAQGDATDDFPGSSNAIISNYLRATQNRPAESVDASVEMEISASVPKLKKQGRLRVLRQMSKVGQITYRVLGFQGDNTVKNQVIARYLQAEQHGKGDQNLAVTPVNYKFKFRGKRWIMGKDVYVFQLSPRHKRVGLFKGEVWLDSATYLPLYEKGRLVKNPSIFFKKVDFERAFSIQNGVPVPAHMTSTIQTRIIGKVELDVNYSNPASKMSFDGTGGRAESSTALLTSSN